MRYKIVGDNLQMVIVEINPGERIYAQAGALNHMSGNVRMEAKAKGGILKGLNRLIAGETFALVEYEAIGGPGIVAFSGSYPGKIMALELDGSKDYVLERGAFIACEEGVDVSATLTKRLSAGFFGGEGFILQRAEGVGTMWITGAGDFIEYNLKDGQVLKVDTGHIVAFEDTVSYEVERAGGLKTILLGGEGIFLAKLVGPGRVILQSMSLPALASAIYPFLPRRS
ncbi:MAG: TIGR00266 family protein [Thermoproteota archaeon]|nr:TIGR00266 family protein [Candidatus Korarchaeota archaeon]RLG44314.1 MAG: TIGR00266 family protein [Candidatus Korarchaeota archaeon]